MFRKKQAHAEFETVLGPTSSDKLIVTKKHKGDT